MSDTVVNLMPWASQEAPLKAYLGIALLDTSEDDNLQLWLVAMAEAADFTLGQEIAELYKGVQLAVFLAVSSLRQRWERPDGVSFAATNSLSEAYKEAFTADASLRAARSLLAPYADGARLTLLGA